MTYGRVLRLPRLHDLEVAAVSHLAELVRGDFVATASTVLGNICSAPTGTEA
jgi:hypothetical protein